MTAVFVVARNPEPASTLPYLLRLPLPEGPLLLKARHPDRAALGLRASQWMRRGLGRRPGAQGAERDTAALSGGAGGAARGVAGGRGGQAVRRDAPERAA